MPSHTFDRHELHPGEDRSLFSQVVVETLLQYGKIQHEQHDPAWRMSLEDEVAGLAALDPQIGSVPLVNARTQVVGAYRAIVRDAFARHGLPLSGGIDIGSGASGYMWKELLPPEAKNGWVQLEVCGAAAQMNRMANPSSTVVQGSYLHLQDQGLRNMLPIISGLSSLDATGHLERAAEQIHGALQPGGALVHVQDVRPGRLGVHQQLAHLRATPPYHALGINDASAGPNTTLLYRDGLRAWDVIELFRQRLGRALQEHGGFDILENRWMTAIGPSDTPGVNKHSELGVFVGLQAQGAAIASGSAVVTVARKR